MMKFLIDVCLGVLIEKKLSESFNYDFKNIRDIDSQMEDTNILKIAYNEKKIIITSDKDFGELIFKNKMKHHGILLLKFDDLPFNNRVDAIINILKNYNKYLDNNFCVYHNNKLRIKKL